VFVVSSKSGTTVETQSGLAYFWNQVTSVGNQPGRHFLAITDPGTPLERLARDRGFRAIHLAPSEVGGRYSALSVFGLVPAGLIGVPIRKVLASANDMAMACGPMVPPSASPALRLGAALGECALAGRDKLVIVASPSLSSLPAWLEQLIAESTGKIGRGIVPVVDEPYDRATAEAQDCVVVVLAVDGEENRLPGGWDRGRVTAPTVRLVLPSPVAVGAEFFRWELAVASAAIVLGVQPFDQPDVQLAKDLARRAMARLADGAGDAPIDEILLDTPDGDGRLIRWLDSGRVGDYVSIQAFLPAGTATIASALAAVRDTLRKRLGVVTTLGYGPRFLHSTGQLHKGGPDSAMCLQLVDEPRSDLLIPGADYTFGQLVRAQGVGDFDALLQRGRRACRVNLGADAAAGLQTLISRLST
jgi:transaldolase/glucose-6-phosphate isomerase